MSKFIILLIFCLNANASDFISSSSFGSLGRDKSIFKKYIRIQNIDPSLFKNRIVGLIGNHCTGTLISPRHVLTAAHCIWNTDTSRLEDDLSFNPASMYKNSVPYQRIDWAQVYLPSAFNPDGNDFKHDFAVIELKESIGTKLGWAGLRVLNNIEDYQVVITGYPADKDEGTQWSVSCPAEISYLDITYLCDTFGGMSGSAVFDMISTDSGRFINGIHVFGTKKSNGAVKITNERFQMIRSWMSGKASNNSIIHSNR